MNHFSLTRRCILWLSLCLMLQRGLVPNFLLETVSKKTKDKRRKEVRRMQRASSQSSNTNDLFIHDAISSNRKSSFILLPPFFFKETPFFSEPQTFQYWITLKLGSFFSIQALNKGCFIQSSVKRKEELLCHYE